MKIIAISDLHGQLPEIKESCDVLCICGDICPLQIQFSKDDCKEWILNTFITWGNTIDCKHILVIAGNHDFVFEKSLREDIYNWFSNSKFTYLENTSIEIDGKTFYGTPYCKEFGNWAFMRSNDHLELIFRNIPENIDVLLTHDAPYGVSDICQQDIWWNNHTHIGSIPLRNTILEKKPKLLLHGHLHTTNHDKELLQETYVYNVSLLNEDYEMSFPPLIIEI